MMLLVHGNASEPSDPEWGQFLQAQAAVLNDIKGVLVYSLSFGPNASQRARLNKLWSDVGVNPKIAVMTNSRINRGIVTAFTWLIGNRIQAFAPERYQDACNFLELSEKEKTAAHELLRELTLKANIECPSLA
jgi:hypothetical protein